MLIAHLSDLHVTAADLSAAERAAAGVAVAAGTAADVAAVDGAHADMAAADVAAGEGPIADVSAGERAAGERAAGDVAAGDVAAGEGSAGRFERVLRYLRAMRTPVDAVLVTGDLADHGADAEYAVVGRLRELGVPLLAVPGNHDERGAFRRAMLGERPELGPVNRVEVVAGAVFALCDSTVPGHPEGWLSDETIDWLDTVLTEHEGVPAFVCCHHPPVPVGKPSADEVRQVGAGRLAAVLGRHPGVVAVLCGHVHSPAVAMFAGVPVITAPGIESTMLLPWEPADRPEPAPMIAFHLLEHGTLTTHFRSCD